MFNPDQITALSALSVGVLTLASLVSGTIAEAAPGYSTFRKAEVQQVIENQNAAKAKGREAHQTIRSGGSVSPKKDGYGSMSSGEVRPTSPVSEASNSFALA